MLRSARWSFAMAVMLAAGPIAPLVSARVVAVQADVNPSGTWTGAIAVAGQTIPMTVTFTNAGSGLSGSIDIQGARGVPLQAVRHDGAKMHFELAAGLGLVILDGAIDGTKMSGTFQQGPAAGTFTLTRASDAPAQAAAAPTPYREEEVTFSSGAVTIAGTLTIPPGSGPFPAVVLLTGSGAQNRDEEIFEFKPFRLIADVLARRGVAVLRCDDRGVGGSSGSIARSTTADFADDALAGVNVLAARKEIDARRIGLIGHSEGTSVAAIAASRDPRIAFVALLAPPAVRGDVALWRQASDMAKSMGASDIEATSVSEAYRPVTDALRNQADDLQLNAAVRAFLLAQVEATPPLRNTVGNRDAYLARTLPAVLAQFRSPWMRYLISFDPSTVLANVHCPVLAMFGERDLVVPIDLNRAPFEAALNAAGNRAVTLKVYPEANHLFLKAVTGSPAEYPALEKTFVPGLLDDLANWVVGVTATGR